VEALVNVIKYQLVPGGALFLLAAVTVGLAVAAVRPRAGRALTILVVCVYWLITLPFVASTLEAGLRGRYQPLDAERAAGLEGIVLLGAGSVSCRTASGQIDLLSPQAAYSALEAARLYHLGRSPLVIASGGRPRPLSQASPESAVLRDALIRLGVPPGRIVEEPDSMTTHDQAVRAKAMLASHGVERFALVASPTHMRRAVSLFTAQGLAPVPSASHLPGVWRGGWLPSGAALAASESASYHYLAIAYAWARGWL
jgi:uncharacterized SAM-binding protein YcdF (DUF218 family)